MNLDEEIRFFDDFESAHGDYDVLGEGAYRQLLRSFRQRVRPRAGEICIDLGCGSGAFSRRLAGLGLKVTGVDISPRSIARAEAGSTDVKYVVGDIRSTRLPDASADIVSYSGVLHHCPEPETRLDVLREGLRILKPGGRLFAFDPNQHSPSMFLFRDPRSPLFSPLGKTPNEVLLSRHQLEREIRDAGFERIQVAAIGGITFRYVEARAGAMILPLYNGVYEQLTRIPGLGRFIGTFLISSAWRG